MKSLGHGVTDGKSRNMESALQSPVKREPHLKNEEFLDQCGDTIDWQDIVDYKGDLGVTKDFVEAHQAAVGQVKWRGDLPTRYNDPGTVQAQRWCSGTLISENLFLTCGHAFSQNSTDKWRFPRVNGTDTPIPPAEVATNMYVVFDYLKVNPGDEREEVYYEVLELVEYQYGGYDYAILRLEGEPGKTYGYTKISKLGVNKGDMLCIIQHPNAEYKKIEAGPLTHLYGTKIGYDDIDTTGGSSGSGILRSPEGAIVGVHTNSNCNNENEELRFNYGVRIQMLFEFSPTLQRIVGLDFSGSPMIKIARNSVHLVAPLAEGGIGY
ncbi:trypsin-like peptidase domain-containing protein, partial [Bacillus cereus]|nr:trypsin-like peptidase domain-containing protein [Bacillus cereus]